MAPDEPSETHKIVWTVIWEGDFLFVSSAVTCSREQKPNSEAYDTVASRLAYYYKTCQKKIWSLGENI